MEPTLRTVVGNHSTPVASDESWDADAAVDKLRKWASSDGSGDKETIDWGKYAKGFTYYDGDDKENFGSYKLPHHTVVDGDLKLVENGASAAMAAINGARGGVDIPSDELKKCYNHIRYHYTEDLDVDPDDVPDFEGKSMALETRVQRDLEEQVMRYRHKKSRPEKGLFFEFRMDVLPNRTTKDSDGNAYITAVASSDSIDSYNEYFSERAIDDMIEYAKARKGAKPSEGLVEFWETHWETFAIGTIVDGWKETVQTKAGERIFFYVKIKLKMDYPAAREIYDDVSKGIADKQLSVGGWIDWDADPAGAWELEEQEFENDDGDTVEVLVGRINRFILEHIAATLPGWAANDDTSFIDAMQKSARSKEIQKSIRRESPEKSDGVLSKVLRELREVREAISRSKESGEEQRMSKARKTAEMLKNLLEDVSDEEKNDLLKGVFGDLVGKETDDLEDGDDPEAEKSEDTDDLVEKIAGKLKDSIDTDTLVRKSDLDDFLKKEDVEEGAKATKEAFEDLEDRIKNLEGLAPEGGDPDDGEGTPKGGKEKSEIDESEVKSKFYPWM